MKLKLSASDTKTLDIAQFFRQQEEELLRAKWIHENLHKEMRAYSFIPCGNFLNAPKSLVREHRYYSELLTSRYRLNSPANLLAKLHNYAKLNPDTAKSIEEIVSELCKAETKQLESSITSLRKATDAQFKLCVDVSDRKQRNIYGFFNDKLLNLISRYNHLKRGAAWSEFVAHLKLLSRNPEVFDSKEALESKEVSPR